MASVAFHVGSYNLQCKSGNTLPPVAAQIKADDFLTLRGDTTKFNGDSYLKCKFKLCHGGNHIDSDLSETLQKQRSAWKRTQAEDKGTILSIRAVIVASKDMLCG